MSFGEILGLISGFMYNNILIFLLIAVGVYFTFLTGAVQIFMAGEAIRVIREKTDDKNAISSFQALMLSTASRVGTGNIIGVSAAICLGGAGAVLWMWIIALLGGASAFVESTLAQIYKTRNSDTDGSSKGGPAYYIQSGLRSRWLGIIFSILLIATFGCGFNMLASYNLVSSFAVYADNSDVFYSSPAPMIIGAAIAVLFGACVFGGGKRLAKVNSILVPVMGVSYVVVSLIIIVLNIKMLPDVFGRIFSDAFNFTAIFGGFSGSCLMYGMKRGLFSNEAGMGSAPNAAASADVTHPVKQGLVQTISVFIDTLLICTATAMMCLFSGVMPTAELAGVGYVQESVANVFGHFGYYFITFSVALFAFTTLLGNYFYTEPNLKFIIGRDPSKGVKAAFRFVAVALVFLGSFLSFGLAWDLADVLMGFMCLVNLPVIVLLGDKALKCLNDYISQKKAGKNPVFKASSIGIEGTDFWR